MPMPPVPMPLSEADYEAIEGAVMETSRGRWFLSEYARRNRHADTKMLLTAIDRLEAAIRGERTAESVDRIRFDLVEMAKAIARTKAEIAAIKPDGEQHGKFGEASEELDSIVGATEAATSDILAAAEHIQEVAWTLREQGLETEVCDLIDAKATAVYTACSFQDLTGQRIRKVIQVLRYLEAEVCDLIDAKATAVYTACSFQDLTGQRIRKVIQVLRYLEGRINAMIDIWGLDGTMAAEAASAARARAGEAALLRGPAHLAHGLDQSDVDVVMGPAASAAPAYDEVEFVDPKPAAAPAAPAAAPPVAPQAAPDPLAPLNALSPEEKIALFS